MTTSEKIEITGISTFAGTAHEVRGRLLDLGKDQQVVALVLPRTSVHLHEAVAQIVEVLVTLTAGLQISHQREALESLVSVFMSPISVPETAIREAIMISTARAEVLKSAEWVSSAQLADLAGMGPPNPNAQTSRWKRDGRIFSIRPLGSVELFPVYGLDPSQGC